MRHAHIAALLSVALIVGGIGALHGRRLMSVSADSPARAFRVLGPVAVADDARQPGASWDSLHAPRLADLARARYEGADAVANVRHLPLPNGSGAVSAGIAVAWE